MSNHPQFSARDLQDLEARGITVDEVREQLRDLAEPPPAIRLERPARVGDGILVIDERERSRLVERANDAALAGRFVKFVPASGAASRMFHSLLSHLAAGRVPPRADLEHRAAAGDTAAADLLTFADSIDRLPFAADLAREMRRRGFVLRDVCASGDYAPVLETLLSVSGLGYANLPKGLLAFHAYPDRARTPTEEHLVEAAGYGADRDRVCRVHFSVSAGNRRDFEEHLEARRPVLERELGARFEVTLSEQHAATDTVAVDLDDVPIRNDDGRLHFRPSGHGALIWNLNELLRDSTGPDVVFIKNIDNVVPDRLKPLVIEWKKILAGRLIEIQARIFGHLRRLQGPALDRGALVDALATVTGELGHSRPAGIELETPEGRAWLVDRLDRPLRVCGMVRNEGEPGGGPFWVRSASGELTLQIVESAQIDRGDPGQLAIVAAATHFNPVDLVCGLCDFQGRPFDLQRYVDPHAVLVTRKSRDGRELKALERPGLWNGAMAGWNSVFVEVPIETFAPVKTVLDLLRPQHRP